MNCPKCGETLKRVEQPSEGPYSMLNADQWRSTIAGDLFCTCHNNYRGNKPYAYFWDSEVGHKGSATALTPTTKQQVMNAIKAQGYYCCTADFGEHEPTCKNYVGESAPPALETQPEEWSPAVKKAMKTFNDAWARRKAAEEDGADCSAGRLGATGTQPSYEWQCMNCSLGSLRAALTPDSTPTQKEKK